MIADNFRTQLNENEFYFGPNTKTLLNFWAVLDRLPERMTREQLRKLAKEYNSLGLNRHLTKSHLEMWECSQGFMLRLSHFHCIHLNCELTLWCIWSSLEICFTQELLDSGHSLIFLPKLIQQLEHYGAL
jgi:hypothetical protein